jgi:hypothetical protein
MMIEFVVTTPDWSPLKNLQDDAFRRPGSIHDFYGESAKDRADLKHASLSLAFIFLIVILFWAKHTCCIRHSDDNISR